VAEMQGKSKIEEEKQQKAHLDRQACHA